MLQESCLCLVWKSYICLTETWIYPCNPSLHLHGQIGAACGKNSCLFSEIDKSIQITEYKSQLETAGKICSAPLSLTPATSLSNEFQSPVPLPHAASFSSCRCCHCWNRPRSQHLQNVSLTSLCLSHRERRRRRYVKERSLRKLLLISLLETVSGIFSVWRSCGSQILAECWCAKEVGFFAPIIKMTGIRLIARTRLRVVFIATLGVGSSVVPSAAGSSQSKWAFKHHLLVHEIEDSMEEITAHLEGLWALGSPWDLMNSCLWWIRCPVSKQNIKHDCSKLTSYSYFAYGL